MTIKKNSIKQIVILAGGLATRLYPVTKTIPKSMVEINGRPFFEYQIDLCKKNGVSEIVLCVGHLWEQIRDYFGDGKRFGVKIIYSVENERLDTGGALKNAFPYLDNEFFVTYGDSYLDIDWQALSHFYKKSRAEGLMSVLQYDWKLCHSQVLIENGYIKEFSKGNPRPEAKFMEYGVNILKKNIINKIPEKKFPLGHYFNLLVKKGGLIAYETTYRFYEIGCHEGKETFEKYISIITKNF
ncbi:MAG: sugar phosphate nucleotidyltransferase [Patescibacteria group bacterium]|nr:sugar phosphate nucleotidyltransferase [Patescibacteria group bacterium]